MSLKFRLNLIITALLLLMMVIGAWEMIRNAREDVRAEVESTASLALHLLDTEILAYAATPIGGPDVRPFRLSALGNVRHLRIEFFDVSGTLRDSNMPAAGMKRDVPPDWFTSMMSAMSPPWKETRRSILFGGRLIGELVITPDPSYEIAEIWSDTQGLLVLVIVFFAAANFFIYWAVSNSLRPVDRIIQALTELERGNLDVRLPAFDLPELSSIASKFNGLAQTLEQSNRRNHALSRQLIQLQEDERKNLARDLHDEIGQSLTAIHADAQAILHSDKGGKNTQESALAIASVAQQMMGMTHQMLQRLRPDTLDKFGLKVALHDLTDSWRPRLGGATCITQISGDFSRLEDTTATTVYRIVQECLTNIARYANARRVSIGLLKEDDGIVVMVEDDGSGFDPDAVEDGFGLTGMRERVEGLGGDYELDTAVGKGTRIVVRLPVHEEGVVA